MSTHEYHQHEHHQHDHAGMSHGSGLNSMAASATLHCLTGCAIGEILGLMIGTAAGLSNFATIVISIALAFVFGFSLSSLPLLNAGLTIGATLSVVVAADTLSITTMEIVDNITMAVIPGAMNAGLVNPLFWIGMAISLTIAFAAAYPVNRYLLTKGKGHALTHEYHEGHGSGGDDPKRRHIPVPGSITLVIAIVSFMAGGLVVSIADELGGGNSSPHSQAAPH